MTTARQHNPRTAPPRNPPLRRRLIVRGIVQGVGFRPFVYGLANHFGLSGWVRNTASGVVIEVQGDAQGIELFERRLHDDRPANSLIHAVASTDVQPSSDQGFSILASSAQASGTRCSIPPDLAACAQCLREVFDPTDRRFGYPFTNCTACGPRYTLITALPYDRANTTMHRFTMCNACLEEYNDPACRRHHAQPIACPACGPTLSLTTVAGLPIAHANDALAQACDAIRDGRIVAVKGLGGFHLMADARNASIVDELRRRKHRPNKPFAVMVPTIEEAAVYGSVSRSEERVLRSPGAPIVLLRRSLHDTTIADSVAPRNPYLGLMLANTPLHHLMLRRLGFPVVATSGNLSNEPICTDDRQVTQQLASVADRVLTHDRPIARAVDDSVVQVIDHAPRVLRCARGYAPMQLPMPMHRGGPILAVGASQKSTVALACDGVATLSQHLGDLESAETCAAQRSTIDDLCSLLRASPAAIAADPHPDYPSTRLAEALGPPIRLVQHHAAHAYAAMAEHQLSAATRVLAVAWDGTGLGDDQTIWGGEILQINGPNAPRVGHLKPFPLPGGDAASRRPSRAALGVLFTAFGDDAFSMRELAPVAVTEHNDLHVLRQMLNTNTNTPMTTSAGRLFDAVASLLGLCHVNTFEGEAAMALQYAAETAPSGVAPLPIPVSDARPACMDWRPAIRDITDRLHGGEPLAHLARAFHLALAQALVRFFLNSQTPPQTPLVLTGGCFQNKLLAELCAHTLRSHGFDPLLHKDVPPNDGGIALGQLYAATLRQDPHARSEP